MRRTQPMDAHVHPEGYCEGCEDDEIDTKGPFVTLVVGGFGSSKRVTLCLECLPRMAELATFAMAKYESEVRG